MTLTTTFMHLLIKLGKQMFFITETEIFDTLTIMYIVLYIFIFAECCVIELF